MLVWPSGGTIPEPLQRMHTIEYPIPICQAPPTEDVTLKPLLTSHHNYTHGILLLRQLLNKTLQMTNRSHRLTPSQIN